MNGRIHGKTVYAVQAGIQEEILSGRLAPGERLGEVALARDHQVSRGPVRAALANLAEAGLVVMVPNTGAWVRQITLADARAIYETRTALECCVCRLVAERATDADVGQLSDLLREHQAEITKHPSGAYLQSGRDNDFHLVLAKMAGNPIIERVLARELYPQLALLRHRHKTIQGRGQEALREHERIIDAIAWKEPEAAEILMKRHLTNSWASISSTMSEGPRTEGEPLRNVQTKGVRSC